MFHENSVCRLTSMLEYLCTVLFTCSIFKARTVFTSANSATVRPFNMVKGRPQDRPQTATAGTQTDNPAPTPTLARIRWRSAVRHVILLIRLRRRWSTIGRHLQLPRIQTLFVGLERIRGRLTRTRPATQ